MNDLKNNFFVRLGLVLAFAYVFIVIVYFFFGFGSLSFNQKDASILIGSQSFSSNQKIKLRPGTYNVTASTPEYYYHKKVTVLPLLNKSVDITEYKADYSSIIKSTLDSYDAYNFTNTNLISGHWLVARGESDEAKTLIAMRYTDGIWIPIVSYGYELDKKPDIAYTKFVLPPDVYAKLQELAK